MELIEVLAERDHLRAEVERLKTELERTKELLIDAKRYGYMGKDSPMMLDRDRYKSIAEKMAEALKRIAIEPLGTSEATHKEVLHLAEIIAKEALAAWNAMNEGRKEG